MIHFNKKTGILSLRLPTHNIPFHYGPDVADGYKDMADAEEHVNKILAALDDQKTPSEASLRGAKKGIAETPNGLPPDWMVPGTSIGIEMLEHGICYVARTIGGDD